MKILVSCDFDMGGIHMFHRTLKCSVEEIHMMYWLQKYSSIGAAFQEHRLGNISYIDGLVQNCSISPVR